MSDEKDSNCCGHCNCGAKHEEKEEKECECGMPLTAETECKCHPEVCVHCCSCPDGGQECGCFCEKKAAADNEDEDTEDE